MSPDGDAAGESEVIGGGVLRDTGAGAGLGVRVAGTGTAVGIGVGSTVVVATFGAGARVAVGASSPSTTSSRLFEPAGASPSWIASTAGASTRGARSSRPNGIPASSAQITRPRTIIAIGTPISIPDFLRGGGAGVVATAGAAAARVAGGGTDVDGGGTAAAGGGTVTVGGGGTYAGIVSSVAADGAAGATTSAPQRGQKLELSGIPAPQRAQNRAVMLMK